jgi:hypothetical protein
VTYSRCVLIWVTSDFAIARGVHQGYPKKLGSIHQTRPMPYGLGAPRVDAGGRFGATLAAYDHRLAQAVIRSPDRATPTASSTRCRCCTTARFGRSSAAPRAGRSTRCSR